MPPPDDEVLVLAHGHLSLRVVVAPPAQREELLLPPLFLERATDRNRGRSASSCGAAHLHAEVPQLLTRGIGGVVVMRASHHQRKYSIGD
jgi:hypothetical protein